MKLKQKQEIKNKPVAEIDKEIKEDREKLRKMRFDLASGKSQNIKEIRATRKKIAMMLTFKNAEKNTARKS